jgi:predicted double-glycine peptidase
MAAAFIAVAFIAVVLPIAVVSTAEEASTGVAAESLIIVASGDSRDSFPCAWPMPLGVRGIGLSSVTGWCVMSQFRLLNRSRQITDYSCGASALRAVLSHWGSEVDETKLMELLHTNSEVGTNPEDIANGARALGFDAEVFENLTLDQLERFTAEGSLVIALAQVWLSEREPERLLEDIWDNGHYVVVLGVDKDYVYFQDPFINMSKAFVPRKSFEDHWHQVMGGDLERNPKLIHLGILVRGKRPAKWASERKPDVSQLDYSTFGSLNLVVTEFDRYLLPFDFLDAIQSIWQDGSVRPNAFIFLRRDGGGNLSGMEGGRLEEGKDIVPMNAAMAAIIETSLGTPERAGASAFAAINNAAEGDFGLPLSELKRIAERLPANHSAVIGIFENVWERSLRKVAEHYGGKVIKQQLMSPEEITKTVGILTS